MSCWLNACGHQRYLFGNQQRGNATRATTINALSPGGKFPLPTRYPKIPSTLRASRSNNCDSLLPPAIGRCEFQASLQMLFWIVPPRSTTSSESANCQCHVPTHTIQFSHTHITTKWVRIQQPNNANTDDSFVVAVVNVVAVVSFIHILLFWPRSNRPSFSFSSSFDSRHYRTTIQPESASLSID